MGLGLGGDVVEMRLASRDVCDDETWTNTVFNRSLCSVSERLHLLACELLPDDIMLPPRARGDGDSHASSSRNASGNVGGKKLEFATRDMVRVFHAPCSDDEDEIIVDLDVDTTAAHNRLAALPHPLERERGRDGRGHQLHSLGQTRDADDHAGELEHVHAHAHDHEHEHEDSDEDSEEDLDLVDNVKRRPNELVVIDLDLEKRLAQARCTLSSFVHSPRVAW